MYNPRKRIALMATKYDEAQYSDVTAAEMRSAMIDSQLRTSDVIDPAVIGAMAAVAREAHVPAELVSVAYMDRAVALGHGRVLNPPLVTGRMLVAAVIEPGVRVLLIGSATGYTAALLARMGAEVHAVEEQADLTAIARAAVTQGSVHWVEGPLVAGAAAAAPFDRVIIDGAIDTLPDAVAAQLAEGGRLVAARRDGAVTRLVQGVKTGDAVALRAFADMDVALLPGFAAPNGFRF
jgi:protein-L-isoaspartate(D-aspartate) O-methyltransferase